MDGESNIEIYNTMCKTQSQWEFAAWLRDPKQGLCDRLKGGEEGGSGTRVYLWLILIDVWQKTTKFCKAIILQLKTILSYVFIAVLGLNTVCSFSPAVARGFLFAMASVVKHGLEGTWALAVVKYRLGSYGLSCSVARGIFRTRDRTHVACISSWTLNNWTTREVW